MNPIMLASSKGLAVKLSRKHPEAKPSLRPARRRAVIARDATSSFHRDALAR
jgi:hypothetical protein